ncbi:MAG: hypothetical protein KatS3mg110_1631 [Pirellulaceae bacterium]|nr:MAG: hypothetical protein KatS3mg110_1631 [Pirellulaceae bacterium]
MPKADLYSPAALLRRAVARLKESWEHTRSYWQDTTCQVFASDRLDPLLPEIQLAVTELDKFTELLREAERACADELHASQENNVL